MGPDFRITVNATQISVRKNLFKALQRIREQITLKTLSKKLPHRFWIDAVCINQADSNEKAHQVGLMSTLYASAAGVLSWLGEGDPEVDAAFGFMQGVVHASENRNSYSMPGPALVEPSPMTADGHAEIKTTVDIMVDDRLVFLFSLSNTITAFFGLQYWKRIWIVQEIALTLPDRNEIMYGTQSMTFRHVQMFRDTWLPFLKQLQLSPAWEATLSRHPDWEKVSPTWSSYIQRMEETLVVWSYYDFLRGLPTSGDSLFYIILSTAYYKTDPRDAVFGLLAMAQGSRLELDYTKSAAQIYTEWFLSVLAGWEDLQPLYFVSSVSASNAGVGVPSWVPDLSQYLRQSPVWDATLAKTIENDSQPVNLTFSGRPAAKYELVGTKVLKARAIRCSTLTIVHNITTTHAAEDMLQLCRVLGSRKISTMDGAEIPALQALFRALMCGIIRFGSGDFEGESAVVLRDYRISALTNQLQFNGSAPLLQAIAKVLLSRQQLSSTDTQDYVLTSLCQVSRNLGVDVESDVKLAAAFIAFMISGSITQTPAEALRSLGFTSNSLLWEIFTECFYPGEAHLVSHLVTDKLLQDGEVQVLSNSINRYFTAFEHTFFQTSAGYLGNGPPTMTVGDEIVVFDGVKFPFIVRPQSDGRSFKIVGLCYVEGLSNGEPAAMARNNQMLVEDIILL